MDAELQRQVYLVCRPIFSGENAKKRKLKAVKQLVAKHRSSLQPLLSEMKETRLADFLLKLLKLGVFESESRARAEFPDLFVLSPPQEETREALEACIAASEAQHLESIVASEDAEQGEALQAAEAEPVLMGARPTGELASGHLSLNEKGAQTWLFNPSYLPYDVQHTILNTTQQVLEECCFEFSMKCMPSLLMERRWSCAAAVELTQWFQVFRKAKHVNIAPFNVRFDSAEARGVFGDLSLLRHTAVHRRPMTAKSVCRLLTSAVALAAILGDAKRRAQLEKVEIEVQSKIDALELRKKNMEDDVCDKLEKIQAQRDALNVAERDTIQQAVKEDQESQMLIGKLLRDSLPVMFSAETLSVAEHETKNGGAEYFGDLEEHVDDPESEKKSVLHGEDDSGPSVMGQELHDQQSSQRTTGTGSSWLNVIKTMLYGY